MSGPESSESFEYNQAEVQAARQAMLNNAAPSAAGAATFLDMVASSQTERKWGVEEGAQRFKSAYERSLHTVSRDFTLLEERITGFANALQECVTVLEADEHDVEGAQLALQNELAPTASRPGRSVGHAPGGYSSGDDVNPIPSSEG